MRAIGLLREKVIIFDHFRFKIQVYSDCITDKINLIALKRYIICLHSWDKTVNIRIFGSTFLITNEQSQNMDK